MIKFLVIVGLGACLLVACVSPNRTSNAPVAPTRQQDAVPPAGATLDESQSGSVRGKLFLQTDSGAQPVSGRILYVAKVIMDSDGNERMASLDRTTSPRTTINEDGSFEITAVPPGRYGLVMDLVVQAYILLEPTGENTLLFDVVKGGDVDLGDLVYTSLPPGAMRR